MLLVHLASLAEVRIELPELFLFGVQFFESLFMFEFLLLSHEQLFVLLLPVCVGPDVGELLLALVSLLAVEEVAEVLVCLATVLVALVGGAQA